MKTYLSRTALTFVVLAALVLPTSPAHAQLLEVKQTVFGMDCAPCAYGLQNGMEAMDGVTSAEVSLNEGLATLQLAPENEVTLQKIRESIREHGFSAEKATLRAAGTLKKEGGRWMLITSAGERFRLGRATTNPSDGDWSRAAGNRVTVTGTVPKGEKPANEPWTLKATALHPTS